MTNMEGVCMTWRQRRILDQVGGAALLILYLKGSERRLKRLCS